LAAFPELAGLPREEYGDLLAAAGFPRTGLTETGTSVLVIEAAPVRLSRAR
jgi:hypothetical protein